MNDFSNDDQKPQLFDNTNEEEGTKIFPRDMVSEMKESYLDYAMSVIVARALPDVRDGLKPVQRRIIFAMHGLGLKSSAKFMKSARIIGETLGKYHPHGDSSVYETMVNMAQDFSMRYPLVWGQGNFGSMDGDSAAAPRYTEAKLKKITDEILDSIDKNTIDFRPNYDGTQQEPSVMPSKLPNLILNGGLGIAVGMATNIPPHNLGEVFDALKFLLDNEGCSHEDLMQFIKGPDFPTGGIIYNKNDILEAYKKGRGGIVIRGKAEIEENAKNGKQSIIITEIPYRQNKADLVLKMANLVDEKILKGITDIRDESNMEGVRIVVELARGTQGKKILNQLYKHTSLQQNFNVNMIALENGLKPRRFSLKDILQEFIKHRRVVIVRRLEFELAENKKKAHILEGLKIALDHIDEVISTIRNSDSKEDAKINLIQKFSLSEVQSDAILEMKLQKLAGLERKKILDDLKATLDEIDRIEKILASEEKIKNEIRTEFTEIREKYADTRKTEVVETPIGEFRPEDFVQKKDVLIVLTEDGYVKRMDPELYRTQNRGGKGVKGTTTKDEDIVLQMLLASTHDSLLLFTNFGKVFGLKSYEVPEGSKISKGQSLANLLALDTDEKVTVIGLVPKEENGFIFFVTEKGVSKRVEISQFKNIRNSGLRALNFKSDEDKLNWVLFTNGKQDIFITTELGQAIRFDENDVRPMGRTASGVCAIKLRAKDKVSSAHVLEKDDKSLLLTLSAGGIGKKTFISEFSNQFRGGVGIRATKITEKTGKLVVSKLVQEHSEDEIILISEQGIVIRVPLKSIKVLSRMAQGVKIMNLNKGDKVAGIVTV